MKIYTVRIIMLCVVFAWSLLYQWGCKKDDDPNTPPVAAFTVSPASANYWTAFACDASGSSDAQDPPESLQVRWDWENDGFWDTEYSVFKYADRYYPEGGYYAIALEVIDLEGMVASTTRNVRVIGGTAPDAVMSIYPAIGGIDTYFRLDASGSMDTEDNSELLKFRWDFESDGFWDNGFSNMNMITGNVYPGPGEYTAKMEVMDTKGMVDSANYQVTVSADGPVQPGDPCPGFPTFYYAGQTYNTVMIGNQCWMKENLNVGENMIFMDQVPINPTQIEKWCIDNNIENCAKYGAYYSWDEMMYYTQEPGARGICPEGWHIPEQSEFEELINYLGGEENAGGALKEGSLSFWALPNQGATNSSGFTALGTGEFVRLFWLGQYEFQEFGAVSRIWSSTKSTEVSAIHLELFNDSKYAWAWESYNTAVNGLPVRCLKD